ncbi:MAG TPA: glycosyltransferase family A protein [Syntrophomonadaceae bacterium]|nr:glycosyltransferase family A protein [Syntrophomonadaceae bacterium]
MRKARRLKRRFQNGISIITCTNRPSFMENVFNNYLRQKLPWKELIIVLNSNQMKLYEWKKRAKYQKNIQVFQIDEKVSLGECYNLAIKRVRYDYIAKFDDDDYYAPLYLKDAIKAFSNTDAHIVGKTCRFIYFEGLETLALFPTVSESSYVKFVVGATMVIKKEVFNLVKFPDITAGEDSEFEKRCIEEGFKIYAMNRRNYVTIRRESKDSHTYKLDDLTYLKTCEEFCRTNNYIDLITGNNYELFFTRDEFVLSSCP